MKFNIFALSITFVSMLFLLSCRKECIIVEPPQSQNGVLISNEGTFGFGNASLSYFDFATGSISNDLFKNANNRPLGDVLQSIYMFYDKGYLIMNNSNKIEVINLATFESLATIDSLVAPRYLLQIDANKAYVSNIYGNEISIIDLNKNRKIGNIAMPSWTEQMVLWEDKVFVAMPTFGQKRLTNHLYVIDHTIDQIVDSIAVGASPSELMMDKDNQIWVMCKGRKDTNDAAGLYRIHPQDLTVTQSFVFSDFANALSPARLAMNGTKDSLFYSLNDIFVLPITANALPTAPVLSAGNEAFYSFGIHPRNSDIYVGDAIDFQQKGKVKIYNSQLELTSDFLVGVGPNGFYFY